MWQTDPTRAMPRRWCALHEQAQKALCARSGRAHPAGDGELLVRASAVLKSQGRRKLAPWETRPGQGAHKLVRCLYTPGRGPVFRNIFFCGDFCGRTFFCFTKTKKSFCHTLFYKKLEFASAPPGDRAASSVSWSDRALRRKFTSGASATGPVS